MGAGAEGSKVKGLGAEVQGIAGFGVCDGTETAGREGRRGPRHQERAWDFILRAERK